MNTQAQIDKRLEGKWEYKGKSKETNELIHLVYEFKDDRVIEKGYLNKSDFIITKGQIVENLGQNKVKIEYSEYLLNGVEDLEIINSFVILTIVALNRNTVKITTEGLPREYVPEPEKDEFVFKRMR